MAKHPDHVGLFTILAIRKDRALQGTVLQRIKEKKEILCLAHHPYHMGMEYMYHRETRVFFVIPNIHGVTLTELLAKNNGRLEEGAVKYIAAQLALAIGDLHDKGIIYRGLTTDSVVIDSVLGSIQIGDIEHSRKLGQD